MFESGVLKECEDYCRHQLNVDVTYKCEGLPFTDKKVSKVLQIAVETIGVESVYYGDEFISDRNKMCNNKIPTTIMKLLEYNYNKATSDYYKVQIKDAIFNIIQFVRLYKEYNFSRLPKHTKEHVQNVFNLNHFRNDRVAKISDDGLSFKIIRDNGASFTYNGVTRLYSYS